jgi:DNA-binding NarL/FixJ family response regulator
MSQLTNRERDVYELVGHRLSNGEIAEELGIAVRTVKVHVSAIFEKLNLCSRVEIAKHYAANHSKAQAFSYENTEVAAGQK